MIFFTYNIPPPANITNMFGNWLNGVKKMDKSSHSYWRLSYLLVYVDMPE
jgi:hypothetical protein